MTEERKFDEETQKFYDDNKEMIEKILTQMGSGESGYEKKFLEEAFRRAAFDRRARMELEAERARREAFDRADQAYSDFKYGRVRTEDAFNESLDHIREFSRGQSDRFLDTLFDELDYMRGNAARGRRYFMDCFDEERTSSRDRREWGRKRFNETFDEYFGPFSDSHFQKHMVGAGLEIWMALNALIRAAPVPDSVKEAFNTADSNRTAEFCSKNPQCRKAEPSDTETSSGEPRQIRITPLKKEGE